MKRTVSIYFLAIVAANVLFGVVLSPLAAYVRECYGHLLPGQPLPHATEMFMSVPWWPYVVAFLGGIGFMMSARADARHDILQHAAFTLAMLDAFLWFGVAVSYWLPLTFTATTMKSVG